MAESKSIWVWLLAIFGLFIIVGFIYLATSFVFAAGRRVLDMQQALKVARTSAQLNMLHSATTNYHAIYDRWPSNMTALVDNPRKIIFISPAPPLNDAWERLIVYNPPSAISPTGYVLSFGADGVPGGAGLNADIQVKVP